jgi:rRNA maturation RNase YbeY
VLSFCESEDLKNFCNESTNIDEDLFLGELILCPDYIEKNAKEDGESMKYALAYIFSHGVFHLLGFKHGKKMFSFQKEIAQKIVKK